MTPRPERLVLVGFMGAGKSTVGKRLAGRLGWSFVDIDEEIEHREGLGIAEIFATRGEAAFREAEARVIAESVNVPRAVIAAGGGALERAENITHLRSAGPWIYLAAEPGTLLDRLQAAPAGVRPLFAGGFPHELLERRRAGYESADFVVHTDQRTPRETVETIVAWLGGEIPPCA